MFFLLSSEHPVGAVCGLPGICRAQTANSCSDICGTGTPPAEQLLDWYSAGYESFGIDKTLHY